MKRLLIFCGIALLLAVLPCPAHAHTAVPLRPTDLAQAYGFLVRDRAQGGILFTATAGQMQGRQLPLSFFDSSAYWGAYVCATADCKVVDVYHPENSTLLPQTSPAGELQTERVNTHNGSNIYDAAVWQIAVMLGAKQLGFTLPGDQDSYALVSNQNLLLTQGSFADSVAPGAPQLRALTAQKVFRYNEHVVTRPAQAYSFRMLPRQWLAQDPLYDSPYTRYINAENLPLNPRYHAGLISWTDWKPITGENAWAFLIGPLQAAQLNYQSTGKGFVPLSDPALQNALQILPTFGLMQSETGGVYYAPEGTVANKGTELVDPHFVSVENNISLYAGLRLLQHVLKNTLARQPELTTEERAHIESSLQRCTFMLDGGTLAGTTTAGLRAFLRDKAWKDGQFVQGGFANKPETKTDWQPVTGLLAVDVNTWGVAALSAGTIDDWHGFGSAFRLWQQVKFWGGYGKDQQLFGVGFSNVDGNGLNADGSYRQSILSAEWTYGAITMVRDMVRFYSDCKGTDEQQKQAALFVSSLRQDEQTMLSAMDRLQLTQFDANTFPGAPTNYNALITLPTNPMLYASRRYFIPFGWYANPLPSTCATAWKILVASHFNPLQPVQK